MKTELKTILVGIILALSFTGIAYGERWVVVNGVRLNNAQIRTLDKWHCGPIANGNYWLNVNTGIWGYMGDRRPMGHISDNCGSQERRPSLSERGLLYSPGELLR